MSPTERRTSLGMLLRRSKSGDLKGKKGKHAPPEQPRETVPKSPPRLPVLYNGGAAPELETFGGETRPDSVAIVSGKTDVPLSARPSIEPGRPSFQSSVAQSPYTAPPFDPYARTESMTNRGRYSYASSAISTINSPRRVRRRKDPTPFNVLVIGTRGSGKTSFIEFLKTALAPKRRAKMQEPDDMPVKLPQGNFIPHYLETEIDHERVGLTIWDSEGLEKNVVDLQLREMSSFLENKFEDTFAEEMKVIRSPGVQDTHIHAVFLVLDPARLDRNISASNRAAAMNGHMNGGGKYQPHHQTRIVGSLDEDLDLQVLRNLQGKTTVIPVISKADTITSKHMSVLKRTVWDSLKKSKLDPLEALGGIEDDFSNSRIDEEDEDEEETEVASSEDLPIQGQEGEQTEGQTETAVKRLSSNSVKQAKEQGGKEEEDPFLPMSIISPDIYEPEVVGRQFPWGFADPYDAAHCDFVRLKDSVFSEWRGELREASREQWYEGWRTSRLKQRDGSKTRR